MPVNKAKAQCSGCSVTISSDINYTATADNQVICLTTGTSFTSYTKTISFNNKNGVTVCVGPGLTVGSSAVSMSGSNNTIINRGTWNYAPVFSNGTSYFKNYGSMTISGAVSMTGGNNFENYGTFSATGTLSMSGGSFSSSGPGSSVAVNNISFASGSVFNVLSPLTISGNVLINSGTTITFGGNTTISGNLTNNGTLTVNSSLTVTNNFSNANSGAVLNLAGSLVTGGNLNNASGAVINVQTPAAGSCVSVCAGSTFTNNGSVSGGTLTSCGAVSGSSTNTVNLSTAGAQPSGLSVALSGSNVTGTFTTSGAAGYLVLKRSGSAVTDFPPAGSYFPVDSTYKTSTVVARINSSTTNTFTDAKPGCGLIYYTVVSTTSQTVNCISINTTAAPSASVTNSSTSTPGTLSGVAAVCSTGTTTLTLANYIGTIVRWEVSDNGTNFGSIGNAKSATFTSPALTLTKIYRVVVNSGPGCSDVNSNSITINQLSSAAGTPTTITKASGTECASNTSTYTSTSANATSFTWTLSGGGTISGTGATGTVVWNSGATGAYTITVRGNNCIGNSSVVSYTANVTGAIGTPSAPSGSTTRCQAAGTGGYTTSAANATSYTWGVTGSGNSISGTGTTGTVTWAAGYSGTAVVSVTATGCSGNSTTVSTNVVVTAPVTPSVAVSTPALSVCNGASVTFTATPTNGGAGPTYVWKKNGNAVSGATSSTYIAVAGTDFVSTDQINCTLTSNVSCPSTATATGTALTMTVVALPTLSSGLSPAAVCGGSAFTYTPASTSGGATFTWTRAAVTGISNAAITSPQSANPNETLVNTTTSAVNVVYAYTVVSGSCSQVQNVTVSIKPRPVTPAITGVSSFCPGGSTTLSTAFVLGANEAFYWSTGATTSSISVNAAGTYSLQVRNTSTGCTSASSNSIVVIVNPLPAVPALSLLTGAEACSGSLISVTNTAGCASCTYLWNDGTTASNHAVSTGANSFSVTVTNTNGCQSATGSTSITGLASGTWLGADNNWSNSANWCGGLPTSTTDVVIRSGTVNMPTNLTGTSSCKNLTLPSGTQLQISSTGTLKLYGSLSGGTINGACGSSLQLLGSSQQSLAATSIGNVLVSNSSNIMLTGKLVICNGLSFTGGNIDATTSPVVFLNTATNPAESSTGRIIGRAIATSRSVGTGSLNFLGVAIAAGADNLDTVYVERRDESATFKSNTGIGHIWTIKPGQQPSGTRGVSLSWLASYSNSKSLTSAQVWRKPEGTSVWLKVGTLQNISAGASAPSISATTTGFSDWTVSDGSNPLPVTLLSFTGKTENGKAHISWVTATESKNKGFDVQRSTDGKVFSSIAFVPAQSAKTIGKKTYSYTDETNSGNAWYRLVQTDLDNVTEIFAPVYVSNKESKEVLSASLFPNPTEGISTLQVSGFQNQAFNVSVFNAAGELQQALNIENSNSENGSLLDISGLPAGFYFIRIETGTAVKVLKLVKN
ncbi:MAG: T9SS type A sorting domain-containing protein [Bacteroidota bacterium]